MLTVTYEGNHRLAIFRTDENYEGLNNALEDVFMVAVARDNIPALTIAKS